MSSTVHRWQSYTSADAATNSGRASPSPGHEPIATIQILIYGTREGASEVRVSASNDGPFSATLDTSSARRGRAYKQLFAVAMREFRNAVNLLGN